MKKNTTTATVRFPREKSANRLFLFVRPAMLQGHPAQNQPPYPPNPHQKLNRGVIATEAI